MICLGGVRRRGSSTATPLNIKVPVLGNQPAVLNNIKREALAARQTVVSGGFPILSLVGNNKDPAQCS